MGLPFLLITENFSLSSFFQPPGGLGFYRKPDFEVVFFFKWIKTMAHKTFFGDV